MSRKTHRSVKILPAARSARSAVHHRRRRGIHHFRKAAPASSNSRKPRNPIVAAHRTARIWDWSIAGACLTLLLFGAAASMNVAGLYLNLNHHLDASYAPHIRAAHLMPLVVILAATFGVLGPTLLASRVGLRMPRPSPTIIGLAGLLTGLTAIPLPVMLSGLAQCNAWIHAHFVFSDWPLRLLQFGLVLLFCILPMCGLGFTARLMHAAHHGRSKTKSPAGDGALVIVVLGGIILGILIALAFSFPPALLLPASSLPLLVLALIAVKMPDPRPLRVQLEPT